MTHPLCGCRQCQAELLAIVKLIDRRQHHREGELENLMDIVYRVCREAEKSNVRTL